MTLDGKMTNTTDVDLKLLSLNIFILIYLWSQITLVNIKGLYHLVTGYSEASVVVRKQLVSPAVLSSITHKPKLYLHIFCTKITWHITCNLGLKKSTWFTNSIKQFLEDLYNLRSSIKKINPIHKFCKTIFRDG